jgi:hypothetical protein
MADLEHGNRVSKVSVVNVNMPFGSMVTFMVKWAIATIPALFILAFAGMFIAAIFAGVGASLF